MKTILLVDDNRELLANLREILTLSDYNVLTADNGKTGIEKAIQHLPDLILSDIVMPEIDGLGLIHVLRKNPKTLNIPIIFLTGKDEPADFRHGMQAGADDYITKPFSPDELLSAVENRLKRAETLEHSLHVGINELQAKAEQLLAVHSFDDCIMILTNGLDPIIYTKKQLIYKEGETPRHLFYLVKGKVKTYKTHEDGKQLIIGLFTRGDFLGHVALLEGSQYKESAETMETTELLCVRRKDFETLLHKELAVAEKMIKMLAKNVTENEQMLLGIAYNTLRKKVAIALTLYQNKFGTDTNVPYIIESSREELAAMAGTARESLIRTLTEFKSEKLININKDNSIEIINPKKLAGLIR